MKTKVWLCVACLELLLPPLSAQEPKWRVTLKGETEPVYSVAFSPDGTTLASGSGFEIKLWDLASSKNTMTLKGHTSRVFSVAFGPDGKTLASGSEDKTIIT